VVLAADRLAAAAAATIGMSMRIEIQLRILSDDGSVISVGKVLHLDQSDDRLEEVGLALSEEGRAGRHPGARGHCPGGEFSGLTLVL
jgi:hypothetical protein